MLASETCALDIVGADFIRDVEPGEIVVINDQGVHSIKPFNRQKERFCVFEYIYFARPDSVMEGMPVYDARKRIGAELAREAGVPADVIVPVPDSGVPAAMGYSMQSGIPFELGIIRNHYVGRTFIEPTDHIRHLGVKLKHSANRPVLEGKRVVLVDDSIVRGTTSKKIVEMVRAAGAKEVHMRISSPPTTHSCFYGIDTPERSKLLAASHSVEEMAELIGADSLAFISIDGLYRALGKPGRDPDKPLLLRCLLHRRLSDCAAGPAGQRGPATQPAGSPPLMSGLLDGAIALVTGASRGIGAAAAIELARLGARVVITARTQGGLEETDDAIRALGGEATILPLDLREGEQIDAIGPTLFQRFGRLDILVHNAGALGRLTPVSHILPDDWADVVAVNLSASWRLIRTCDPLLRQAPAGRAVFVTESRAREPRAYWGAMGATKAGMEHLVLTWAQEVATTNAAGQPVRSGAGGDPHAVECLPGRGPDDLADAGSGGTRIGRPMSAGRTTEREFGSLRVIRRQPGAARRPIHERDASVRDADRRRQADGRNTVTGGGA